MTVHIFLTGAMGFIGGGVLGTLYPLIQENKYTVTALVRSEAKASPFHKYAIDTVIGTLDDFATIEQETAKADAVIHTASDEHIPAIHAIIAGARKRLASGGNKPILIHTSGCGFAIDDKFGIFEERMKTPIVSVSDSNIPSPCQVNELPASLVEQYMTIPDNVPHRACELQVLRASTAGVFKGYIVAPAVVYGVSTRALSGASSRIGFGPKLQVGNALQLDPKQARSYGPLNRWNLVHVDDLADLYILILEAALEDQIPSGWEGVYFAENGVFK